MFPIEKLSELKIEKYALQKGKAESKTSFCYWLENELESLGITFLRLDDRFIKTQIQHAIRVIEDFIQELEKQSKPITTP